MLAHCRRMTLPTWPKSKQGLRSDREGKKFGSVEAMVNYCALLLHIL